MKPAGAIRLRVVAVSLREANGYVLRWHRHLDPCVGHKFSLAVQDDSGFVHGVAITGRPIARLIDKETTMQIARVATDGAPNACSMLYGASVRKAFRNQAITSVITYTLERESGVSLRASGAICEGRAGKPGKWNGRGRRLKGPAEWKVRWRWTRPVKAYVTAHASGEVGT